MPSTAADEEDPEKKRSIESASASDDSNLSPKEAQKTRLPLLTTELKQWLLSFNCFIAYFIAYWLLVKSCASLIRFDVYDGRLWNVDSTNHETAVSLIAVSAFASYKESIEYSIPEKKRKIKYSVALKDNVVRWYNR